MESIIKKLMLISSLLIFFSCEEVIDLKLPSSSPRLVVEANLDFNKDSNKIDTLFVKLSLTTDFYSKNIPKVHGAKVWIETDNSETHQFIEDKNTGIYFSNFKKIEYYQKLKLHIEYLDEKYDAQEMLFPSPELSTRQQSQTYFGKKFYIAYVEFKDLPPNTLEKYNYYLTERQRNNEPLNLFVQNNEFTQGNIMFNAFIVDDETRPGDLVTFSVYQISKTYYNYMYRLIDISNNAQGPFQTPTGQVRGNIQNLTNPENYPLGYFRVTEKKQITHKVIEDN